MAEQEVTSEDEVIVRCVCCPLAQRFGQVTCRRCRRPLPRPAVIYRDRIVERMVEVVVEKIVEVEVLAPTTETVLFGKDLPTMPQVVEALIHEAMRRNANHGKTVARVLGIGKTTVYRKLKELGYA